MESWITYSVAPDSEWQEEHDMSVRLGKVLSPGMTFQHEYDFGSTTELELSVKGEREGRSTHSAVRLLARNEAPV